MKKLFLFLVLFLGVVVWSPVLDIFYLQDEWQGLGHIFVEGLSHPFAGSTVLEILSAQSRTLARLSGLVLFGAFPFNAFPAALFSLIFHLFNTYLVYVVSKKVVKKEIWAIFASTFFLFLSTSANAVYWFSTSVGTLPATTLILFALIKWQNKKTLQSFLLIYISLFFKEIGLFLLILIPFFDLFIEKKKFGKTYFLYLFTFAFVAAVRVLGFKTTNTTEALFLTGNSENFWWTLLVRAIFYPTTSFSLTFLPYETMFKLGSLITSIYYQHITTENFLLFVQGPMIDILAIFFTAIFVLLIILFNTKEKKNMRRQIVFWTIFVFGSFLPYIIVGKSFSYLESRYYYLGAVGASVLVGWLVDKKKIFLLLFVPLAILHLVNLETVLVETSRLSIERKNIVKEILNKKPTLTNNKNIFIIESKTDYYVVGNMLPFQQGVGYMLMTMYYDSGEIPPDFLTNNLLWDIGSEGYYEKNDQGFGFFWSKENLKRNYGELLEKNINDVEIIDMFYDSQTGKLTI